mmetsp:Transcript_20583/g.31262  ORF Transcript_20583/g.31262 Transcript_20583/m.31262 type:complete len:88 (+) Transcript_20583:1114-1377(+)
MEGSIAGTVGSGLDKARMPSWILFGQLPKFEFAASFEKEVLNAVSLSDIWVRTVKKAAPTQPPFPPIAMINGFADAATVGPAGLPVC